MTYNASLDFSEIARSTDLRRLVSDRLGEPGPGNGKWHCPSGTHTDLTPSFTAFVGEDGKPRVKCQGCGWRGDAIDFLVKIDACDERDAAAYLVEKSYAGLGPLRGPGRQTGRKESCVPPPTQVRTAAPAPRKPAIDTRPGRDWHREASLLVKRSDFLLWRAPIGPRGHALFPTRNDLLRIDAAEIARMKGWLAARGLTEETARRFALGFWPADDWSGPVSGLARSDGNGDRGLRLHRGFVIPFARPEAPYDPRRILTSWSGVTFRRLDADYRDPPAAAGGGKYQFLEGSETGGLYPAPPPPGTGPVLVTEGYLDALVAIQETAKLDVAVVSWGSASVRKLQPEAVASLEGRRLLLAFDRDPAGDRAAAHWINVFGERATLALVPSGKDVGEYHTRGGRVRDWVAGLLAV